MARLDDRLERLATLSPTELRAEWQDLRKEDGSALPPSLLRLALAYELQERALGGLPASAQRYLEALARDPSTPAPEPDLQIKAGTRLLREWQGKLHSVIVTEDGVLFEDRRYASLSHVAREITGAHWSGPRFFGLKRRANPAPYRGRADG